MRVLADSLVEILVCPKSKQPLIYFPRGEANAEGGVGFLVSPESRLRYRIDDGVPVLLVEEAEELSVDTTAKLVARAKQLGLRVPA
ncbi:MAG: Trm112 family protein [Kofleriaceae bacterium]